jgi:carboxynorspermidine decarboxylase
MVQLDFGKQIKSCEDASRMGFTAYADELVQGSCAAAWCPPAYRPAEPRVPIGSLLDRFEQSPRILDSIGGIHFHTNCDSEFYTPIWKTAKRIEKRLRPYLSTLNWVNLGGGYLFDSLDGVEPLQRTVALFRDRYGLEVYFEPGAAFVREAGFLVAEVIDLFESGGRMVAVLNSTINHLREILEY